MLALVGARHIVHVSGIRVKEEYWQTFTKNIERDLYGSQKKIWKMLRNRKSELNETLQLHKTSGSVWWQHFSSLYNSDTHLDNTVIADEGNDCESERIEITENEF